MLWNVVYRTLKMISLDMKDASAWLKRAHEMRHHHEFKYIISSLHASSYISSTWLVIQYLDIKVQWWNFSITNQLYCQSGPIKNICWPIVLQICIKAKYVQYPFANPILQSRPYLVGPPCPLSMLVLIARSSTLQSTLNGGRGSEWWSVGSVQGMV